MLPVMASDWAFQAFLATVNYQDMSAWERRMYLFKQANPGVDYDPDVEEAIRAYALAKKMREAA